MEFITSAHPTPITIPKWAVNRKQLTPLETCLENNFKFRNLQLLVLSTYNELILLKIVS